MKNHNRKSSLEDWQDEDYYQPAPKPNNCFLVVLYVGLFIGTVLILSSVFNKKLTEKNIENKALSNLIKNNSLTILQTNMVNITNVTELVRTKHVYKTNEVDVIRYIFPEFPLAHKYKSSIPRQMEEE